MDNAASLFDATEQAVADVLMLDWELPGLTARMIRDLVGEKRPFTHIVAMSSRPESHAAARAAGVIHFISKSEPPDRVREILYKLMSNRDATHF